MGEGAAEEDAQAGRGPDYRRVAQWIRDYSRLPGIPDEFLDPDGAPRAVWSRFFDAFGALAPDEIERRFAMADRHLREAGVTYRAPGDSADRLWPLSHLPLLIDEADWQQLTAGIKQRAALLEIVLRDIYGEGPAGGERPHRARGRPRFLRLLTGRRHHRRLAEAEARCGRGRAAGGVTAVSLSAL
jgi:Circularly permuted ATP-grasp type 2